MPPNTVYVGRPTRFGNYLFNKSDIDPDGTVYIDDYGTVTLKRAWEIYRNEVWNSKTLINFEEAIKPLRGKNLACWCPLDQPCHADILLEIANKENK